MDIAQVRMTTNDYPKAFHYQSHDFRVYHYKSKYMTSDRFQNVYLNEHFYELDRNRTEMGLEAVLPLRSKEIPKYLTVS